MKISTKKTSFPNLTRLPASRNATANSTNLTSSLFGPRKNVVVTYSKVKPFHFVKRSHFLTPDTPHLSTPDSLQTTGKQITETTINSNNRKTDHGQQGGSSTSGINLLSIEAKEQSSLNVANSMGSTLKPRTPRSSIALRNISNIPIEKTLSRTQCTPSQQHSSQTSQLSKRPSKNATRKSKPHSSKLKSSVLHKRIKESASALALKEISEEQQGSQEERAVKQQNADKCDWGSPHLGSTDYSMKSMSAGTAITSRSSSRLGKTLTAQSMSLCTTNETDKASCRDKSNEDTLLPKNSTFNESGEKLQAQDCLKDLLSPITDELYTEQKQKKDTVLRSSTTQQQQSCQDQNTMCEGGPRTSTPVDQGNTTPSNEPEFSPILEDKEPTKMTNNNGVAKVGQMSKGISQNKNTSTKKKKKQELHSKENSKDDVHKADRPNKRASLPLQASMCIEDDNDQEHVPDNITPEIMPPKSNISSSKRKLEYFTTSMPFKPDTECCFLLDFKCTVKKPCKIWMRTKSSSKLIGTDKESITYPQDNLTCNTWNHSR